MARLHHLLENWSWISDAEVNEVKSTFGGMVGKTVNDIVITTQNAGWAVNKNSLTAVIVDKDSMRRIAAFDVFEDGLIVPGLPDIEMEHAEDAEDEHMGGHARN